MKGVLNDDRPNARRWPALIALFLMAPAVGCGGGGGVNDCADDPLRAGVAALSEPGLTKDFCQSPTAAEVQLGASRDATLSQAIRQTNRHDAQMQRLRQAAGISASVRILVADDLQRELGSVGGGIAGFDLVYIDGKLLDIFVDYGAYLALIDAGYAPQFGRNAAIDVIVSFHNASLGAAGRRFPTPDPEIEDAALDYADSLAAAIVFHEYGHYWAWALSDSVRLNFTPYSRFFYFPSKVEDDADLIAGVLTAKANLDGDLAVEMYDIMTFQALHRTGSATSIANVEAAWAQFIQTTPGYMSLAGRKSSFRYGISLFRS